MGDISHERVKCCPVPKLDLSIQFTTISDGPDEVLTVIDVWPMNITAYSFV
jgi:hypothetical protein